MNLTRPTTWWGGDWGEENQPHSHHYRMEVVLEGPALDRVGYLFDITLIDQVTDELVGYFAGKTLNDLPEFAGLTPVSSISPASGAALS